MSYLHDEAEDVDALSQPQHRELTLGTPAILAIFTGLVLLCGLFFGIGYNMGSKARPVSSASIAPETPSPAPNFNGFKPAPGTAATNAAAARPTPTETHAPSSPVTRPEAAVSVESSSAPHPPAPIERVPPEAHPATASDTAGGAFTVQIAAVSHAEDADLLVSALRRKGYAVTSRSEPQDKLFHVQVGPFATRKEADAMKQRLAADGYNPIVK